MTILYAPTSGRLVIRQLREGTAIVGLAFFPVEFEISEGAAYLMSLCGGRMGVFAKALDDGIPQEYAAAGLSNLLCAHAWYRTGHAEMMTVRFVAAFPEQNGWAFASAAETPLSNLVADDSGHAWFDLDTGELQAIAPPVDARGMAMGQLLTGSLVWPTPGGDLYRVSQMESAWRPDFLRNSQLLARVGRGEIDLATYRDTVRADPRLLHIAHWSVDQEYCRYLAMLERAGGLTVDTPSSVDEWVATEALSDRIIRESTAGWIADVTDAARAS